MLKKRKITRKDLDELRKTMPVLSENEQRRCVGMARYFDTSGNYLGTFGEGLEMRIIDPQKKVYLLETGASPNQLHGESIFFASDETKRAILQRHFLPTYLANFEFTDQPGIMAGFATCGQFHIGRGAWMEHAGDIKSIITHEIHHFNSGNFTGCWREEYNALMAQINSDTYNNTSPWLREHVYHRLVYTKTKLGYSINRTELMRLARVIN